MGGLIGPLCQIRQRAELSLGAFPLRLSLANTITASRIPGIRAAGSRKKGEVIREIEAWREAREGPLEEWREGRWRIYEPLEWHYMVDGQEVSERKYKRALAKLRRNHN